jgi:malonate decarboxylase gamma subunit
LLYRDRREPIMTLDEVLTALFPGGHSIERGPYGAFSGTGRVDNIGEVAVIGISDGTPLGIEGALALAGYVLTIVEKGGGLPIVVLTDTSSQNMARRDELLGLNEYLGHLYKCLAFAGTRGHRTIAVLYGTAAAGAFIATTLPTMALATLPGAKPFVMDLPSISRVTKLPLEKLTEMAKATPIFAPGVDPLFATGAVTEKWSSANGLAKEIAALLARLDGFVDQRDQVGLQRKGRMRAAAIAQRVQQEAGKHV